MGTSYCLYCVVLSFLYSMLPPSLPTHTYIHTLTHPLITPIHRSGHSSSYKGIFGTQGITPGPYRRPYTMTYLVYSPTPKTIMWPSPSTHPALEKHRNCFFSFLIRVTSPLISIATLTRLWDISECLGVTKIFYSL